MSISASSHAEGRISPALRCSSNRGPDLAVPRDLGGDPRLRGLPAGSSGIRLVLSRSSEPSDVPARMTYPRPGTDAFRHHQMDTFATAAVTVALPCPSTEEPQSAIIASQA
jgi:hypothetical protein